MAIDSLVVVDVVVVVNDMRSGQRFIIRCKAAAAMVATYTILARINCSLTNEFEGCDDCGPCGTRTVLGAFLPPGDYNLAIEGYSSSGAADARRQPLPSSRHGHGGHVVAHLVNRGA